MVASVDERDGDRARNLVTNDQRLAADYSRTPV
jgi:hypothetical protein